MKLIINIPEDVKEKLDSIESLSDQQQGDLEIAVMNGTSVTESFNIWHTIKGFDNRYSYDANIENGVELPIIGSDVLVIYPRIPGVHVKKSTEEGMTGTSYYNGTMWSYYNKPIIEAQIQDGEQAVCNSEDIRNNRWA